MLIYLLAFVGGVLTILVRASCRFCHSYSRARTNPSSSGLPLLVGMARFPLWQSRLHSVAIG